MEKPIKNYPAYTVDLFGTIRLAGREIHTYDNNRGYLKAFLTDENGKRKSVRVHRIVAETFIENPLGLPVVNHIDGNKYNNRVDNLEWVSYKENTRLSLNNHFPVIKPIAQISPRNGAVKGVFLSIRNCSLMLGLDYRGLFEAVKQEIPYKGYLWKYCCVTVRIGNAPPNVFE